MFERQQSTEKKENSSQQDEKPHKLRLSIDISSLKDHQFRGVIYAKYTHQPQLGIKQQFRTSPAIEITQPVVETAFPTSFSSYLFESTKDQLQQIFDFRFQVEVWHQDRLKKDSLVGVSFINLLDILKSPVRKTSNSYVRVHDAQDLLQIILKIFFSFFPIDEIQVDDETGEKKQIQRIGAIRCIFYLEDLGPVELLQTNEKQMMQLIVMIKQTKFLSQYQGGQQDPGMPGVIPIPSSEDPEKQKLVLELNSLEHKVIWELETWKKSEEARFRVQLKQKEIEFLQKLSSESKMKENDRDRQFKQSLAQVNQIVNQMNKKSMDLQKREQKILQLEEELKQKMIETAKIVKQKEEEQGQLIRKGKEDKLTWEKEKTQLNLKMADLQVANQRLHEEINLMKKDMDNSPIALVKGELQNKNIEINELKKEIDKINQIKDQYKQYYEKVRDELIRSRKAFEDLQQSQQNQSSQELEQMKKMVNDLKSQLNVNQMMMQQQEKKIASQQKIKDVEDSYTEEPEVLNKKKPPPIQQKSNYQQPIKQIPQTSIKAQRSQQKKYPSYDEASDELQRLIQEREYLLNIGEYDQNDPLIIEITKHIQELEGQ